MKLILIIGGVLFLLVIAVIIYMRINKKCTPDCRGKKNGDPDGCGGTCYCTPKCTGGCGMSDGCGGACKCPNGQTCENGKCVGECINGSCGPNGCGCDWLSECVNGECRQNACQYIKDGINEADWLPEYNQMCNNMDKCYYYNPVRENGSIIPDRAEIRCTGGPTNGKTYKAHVMSHQYAFKYDESTDSIVVNNDINCSNSCTLQNSTCSCSTDNDARRVGCVNCKVDTTTGKKHTSSPCVSDCDGTKCSINSCGEKCQCSSGTICDQLSENCIKFLTFRDHKNWSVNGGLVAYFNELYINISRIVSTPSPDDDIHFTLQFYAKAILLPYTAVGQIDLNTGVVTFDSLPNVSIIDGTVITGIPQNNDNAYKVIANGQEISLFTAIIV
jgi:hypothetical protein